MVTLGDELGDAFVDGTAHIEAELRIESIFHVGKVLVRQELHEQCGDLGHASFVVALVPHAATSPFGLILGTDVVNYFGRDDVGKLSRKLAGGAILIFSKLLTVLGGAVDEQGAYDVVVGCGAGIGVEAERYVDRYFQARFAWQHVAAASQVVYPLTTTAVIVNVVVDAVAGGVYFMRESRPLQEVAGAKVEPGVVATAHILIVDAFFAQIFHVIVFLCNGNVLGSG